MKKKKEKGGGGVYGLVCKYLWLIFLKLWIYVSFGFELLELFINNNRILFRIYLWLY